MLTVQQFKQKIKSQEKFKSSGSGQTYTSEQLQKQLNNTVEKLENGEQTPSETLRYFPRGKLRQAWKEVLKTDWFDIASHGRKGYRWDNENNPDKENFYLEHIPTKKQTVLPYQGYKIRVTTTLKEARSVIKAVLKPLRDLGEFHKFVPSMEKFKGLKGGSQEGKLITVYPEVSKKDVIKNDKHIFTKNTLSELNKKSVNANYESTKKTIKTIEQALKNSSASLKGGNIPPTDAQYKNTRISYRYGEIVRTKGKFLNDGKPFKELVNVEGKTVEDNRTTGNNDNWRTLYGRKTLD